MILTVICSYIVPADYLAEQRLQMMLYLMQRYCICHLVKIVFSKCQMELVFLHTQHPRRFKVSTLCNQYICKYILNVDDNTNHFLPIGKHGHRNK